MTEVTVRIPSVLGVKTTGDHIRIPSTLPQRLRAAADEIERLEDQIVKLQAIIDKQLY